MKRILLILTLITLSLAGRAQIGDYRSELAVGGGAGYVFSNIGFLPEVPQA